MILYLILFFFSYLVAYTWCLRENLTVQDLDTKVINLEKHVKKLKTTLDTQEERMKSASTQASQAQSLLHANTKI